MKIMQKKVDPQIFGYALSFRVLGNHSKITRTTN